MKKNKDDYLNMSTLLLIYQRDYEKYVKIIKTLFGLSLLSIVLKKINKGEL